MSNSKSLHGSFAATRIRHRNPRANRERSSRLRRDTGGKVVNTSTGTVTVPVQPLVGPVTEYGQATKTEMTVVLTPDDQL